MIATFS